MRATLNLNTNIQITVNQLFDLAKQLPQQERIKLASFLVDENEDIMTKSELIGRIRNGLQDVKLHKEGKIKLRTLSEFLADV